MEVTMAKTKGSGAPSWALDSWKDLNDFLRTCDERGARAVLAVEMKRERPRKQFVMRIHSRINKVRADVERAELRRKVS